MASMDHTTEINPETLKEAYDFEAKNVCFIGCSSEKFIKAEQEDSKKKISDFASKPHKRMLSNLGHCVFGTETQSTHRRLIDLITEQPLDDEQIQGMLLHEARQAIKELAVRAVALPSFGYERYTSFLQQELSVPILKPSDTLKKILKDSHCRLGLVGTTFDLVPEFWNNLAQECQIEIALPEKGQSDQLTRALVRAAKLNGQDFLKELEQACTKQVQALLTRPDPPTQILFCNIELADASKRVKCERRNVQYIDMLNILRRSVVEFQP